MADRQVTIRIPADVLEEVEEVAAYGRTAWILEAIEEKLDREAAIAEHISAEADRARVREIVRAYNAMNANGRIWLHLTACIARGADDFKDLIG